MKPSYYMIDNSQAMVLAHKLRWRIMQMLIKNQPIYAKQLAEEIEISESKLHYHLTQLRKAGLIKIEGIRSIKQGRAKLLKPIATHFHLSLDEESDSLTKTFFSEVINPFFYTKNTFNTYIVVGSSVPHGKYDAISRDGHLAGELCWYLGSNALPNLNLDISNLVMTDLEYMALKSSSVRNRNLILIGGPITNEITAKYNKELKNKFNVYFSENTIVANDKIYNNSEDGLIAVFKSSKNKNSRILMLAGVGSVGTRSTIYSITNGCSEILYDKDEYVSIFKAVVNENNQISGVKGHLTKGLK